MDRVALPASNNGTWRAHLACIYVALLLFFPSGLSFTVIGAIGRPSVVFGVVLLVLAVLQTRRDPADLGKPSLVEIAAWGFALVVGLEFAIALGGQLTPSSTLTATTGIVKVASWIGVVSFIALLRKDFGELSRVSTFFVLAATLLALLGLAQFLTKSTLLGWFALPGFSTDADLADASTNRGGFLRASGTAVHPLEYSLVLITAMPMAVGLGVASARRPAILRWLPAVALLSACAVSLSRSALISTSVSLLIILCFIGRSTAMKLGVTVIVGVGVLFLAVPSLGETVVGLFSNLGDDASSLSRQGALQIAPELIRESPILGRSFGTFLPQYYIFDNAYVLLAVETGILGSAAFAIMIVAAGVTLVGIIRTRLHGSMNLVFPGAVLASLVGSTLTLSFFDGLSFPQSGGSFFVLLGIVASMARSLRPKSHGGSRQ